MQDAPIFLKKKQSNDLQFEGNILKALPKEFFLLSTICIQEQHYR